MPAPNPQVSPWITGPIAAVFLLSVFAIAFWLDQRRKRVMQRFAQDHGLEFHEEENEPTLVIPDEFVFHENGPLGTDPQVWVSFEGIREGAMIAAAIVWYMGYDKAGPQRKGYPVTIAYVRDPELRLPQFSVSPERLRHRITDGLRGSDIDFPDSPDFSRRFRLRGTDAAAVAERFTFDVRRFFGWHPGVCAEGLGDTLIYYRPTRMFQFVKFRPRAAKTLLDEAWELRTLLREYRT